MRFEVGDPVYVKSTQVAGGFCESKVVARRGWGRYLVEDPERYRSITSRQVWWFNMTWRSVPSSEMLGMAPESLFEVSVEAPGGPVTFKAVAEPVKASTPTCPTEWADGHHKCSQPVAHHGDRHYCSCGVSTKTIISPLGYDDD